MDSETLVVFGGEIKALGDGRVGGYLVRFTNADDPDLENDFFDARTDFDITNGDRVTVYYNHGMDATLKRRKLGSGTVRIDEVGVWMEAQLQLRDGYEQAIYQLVQQGKMGLSSGSLPNLVEREPVGKAMWIKSWPLGKDASITPTPAAGPFLTAVSPLKSWAEESPELKLVFDPSTNGADKAEQLATPEVSPEASRTDAADTDSSGKAVSAIGAEQAREASSALLLELELLQL